VVASLVGKQEFPAVKFSTNRNMELQEVIPNFICAKHLLCSTMFIAAIRLLLSPSLVQMDISKTAANWGWLVASLAEDQEFLRLFSAKRKSGHE
jgi:hypothetical protein